MCPSSPLGTEGTGLQGLSVTETEPHLLTLSGGYRIYNGLLETLSSVAQAEAAPVPGSRWRRVPAEGGLWPPRWAL